MIASQSLDRAHSTEPRIFLAKLITCSKSVLRRETGGTAKIECGLTPALLLDGEEGNWKTCQTAGFILAQIALISDWTICIERTLYLCTRLVVKVIRRSAVSAENIVQDKAVAGGRVEFPQTGRVKTSLSGLAVSGFPPSQPLTTSPGHNNESPYSKYSN